MSFSKPNSDVNVPASRVVWDSHAFMHEDKFDTWLDLTGLFEFRDLCKQYPTWDRNHFSVVNHFISADTIAELNQLGVTPQQLANCEITPTLPARILLQVLTRGSTSCHMPSNVTRDHVTTIKEAAKECLSIQLAHLTSHMSSLITQDLNGAMDTWIEKLGIWTPEVMSAFLLSEDMMYLLRVHKSLYKYAKKYTPRQRAIARTKQTSMRVYLKSIKASFIITHDIVVCTMSGKQYLLDKGLFLELINKSCELFCVLHYSHMQDGASMPKGHLDFVVSIIKHYCSKVVDFSLTTTKVADLEKENRGFIYLKAIEGLGVAELIRRGDQEMWINVALQNTLWNTIHSEQLDVEADYQRSTLKTLFDGATSAQIAEVLGLVKLAGHPSIEVQKGVQKLYDRTHEEIVVDGTSVQRSIAMLTKDLVYNFYIKHRRYPRIDLDSTDLPQDIRTLFLKHTNISTVEGNRLFERIPLENWSQVRILKNCEFDKVDQQITLLKDKSIGLSRTKALKLLMQQNPTVKVSKGSIEERRALLHFLLSSEFSHEFNSYMESYIGDDPWTGSVLDYLVIKLTAKELEEKPEGRMFGASPGVERNRRIVQEFNVMSFMSKYVPEQLLTPDELTLIKKLYSFRYIKQLYPDHEVFQVSFDFSKWNNSMRSASINVPGAAILDRWFDTRLYGRTMEAYENSLVYYKDNHYSRWWDGQYGGIEGLNQATWSYVFLGGIKQALSNLGVIYQVTVKGDDVRAAIVVSRQTLRDFGIPQMRDQIMERLRILCVEMGWQLNPQESFVSFSLICTSKQYQVNDTWLPASAKKMMKAESLSNLVFPTTEDIISSVFSTAHSACSQTTVALPCFATAVIIAARVLTRDLHQYRLDYRQICILLCWPQILGGPGALPLQTFLVRGENDMLSVSLSLLRHLLVIDQPIFSDLAARILSVPLDDNKNMKQFLSDPYSVPLKVPTRPEVILKNLIRGNMKYWINNQSLKFLITNDFAEEEEKLVQVLCSMKPMCPKLVTSLYENSPFYLKEEIVAKFMMSSTIFTFFQKGKSRHLSFGRAHERLRRVLDAARERVKFWVRIIKTPPDVDEGYLGVPANIWRNFKGICSTKVTQMVREACWGVHIIGLTYPSLVDQNMIIHPDDLRTMHPLWDVRNITSQVTVRASRAIYQTDDRSHHYAAVPGIVPWIGSRTTMKLSLPFMDSDIRSPVINKVLNLLGMKRVGYYLGTQFRSLVDKLLRALTPLDVGALDVLMPEGAGGHLAHRVQINSFSMNTMPNVRPNLAQMVMINNESLMTLRADNRNRTINFAARHYYLITMALFTLQFQNNLQTQQDYTLYSIFHNKHREDGQYELCDSCMAIVDDEMIEVGGVDSLDFSEFSTYELIGASDYENKVLKANIGAATIGKARRLLRDEHLDTNNPVNIAIASNKVVSSEFKSSMTVYNAAQSAHSVIIPSHEMLDVMKVNLAGGTYLTPQFSLQVIRNIQPRPLYMSVVQECFQFYLSLVGYDWNMEEFTMSGILQAHMNPIAGVFERLNTAGMMLQLANGARLERLIPQDIVWPIKSYSDSHVACKYFMRMHELLFRSMIEGDAIDILARVRFYVNMESDETIKDSLRDQYTAVLRSCVLRSNRRSSYGRPIGKVLASCKKYVDKHKEDFPGGMDDFEITPESIEKAKACASWILDHHWPEQVKRNNIKQGEMDQCITRLTFIGTLAMNLHRGDWDNWELLNIMHLSEKFTLVRCTIGEQGVMVYDIPDPTIANIENIEVLASINRYYGTFVTCVVFIIAKTVYFGDDIDANMLDLMMTLNDDVVRWLRLVGTRQVCIMSTEDAERVLRSQVVNFGFNTSGQENNLLQEYRRDPLQHNLLDYCRHKPATHAHHAMRQILVHRTRLSEAQYRHLLDPILQHRINQVRSFPGIDLSYYFNITTGLSWTAGRLLECLNSCGVLRLLDSAENPFLGVVCGDGGGGCSKLILTMFDNSMVVYCSKYFKDETGQMADDASLTTPPYEFQPSLCNRAVMDRLVWNGFYPGDINQPSVRAALHHYVVNANLPKLLFISDAEFPLQDYSNHLLTYLISFFKIVQPLWEEESVIIIKLHVIPDATLLYVLMYLRSRFQHFHLWRSSVARSYNLESHMVCSGLIGQSLIAEDISSIMLRNMAVAYNYRLGQELLDSIMEMYDRVYMFKLYSLNINQSMSSHLEDLMNHVASIRSLDQFVNRIGITHPVVLRNLCALTNVLLEAGDRWRHESYALLDATLDETRWLRIHHGDRRARGGRLRITTSRGVGVAEVGSTTRLALESIARSTFFRQALETFRQDVTNVTTEYLDHEYLSLRNLRNDLRIYIDDDVCSIRMDGPKQYLSSGNIRVCLDDLWRQFIKDYLKLIGTHDMLLMLADRDIEKCQRLSVFYSRQCQVMDCCRAMGHEVRRRYLAFNQETMVLPVYPAREWDVANFDRNLPILNDTPLEWVENVRNLRNRFR